MNKAPKHSIVHIIGWTSKKLTCHFNTGVLILPLIPSLYIECSLTASESLKYVSGHIMDVVVSIHYKSK